MGYWTHRRISAVHRWAGLILTIPLLSWIVSSQMLHYIGMTAPNGLQGIYQLNPVNSNEPALHTVQVPANEILSLLESEHGLDRVHWIRLEAFGDRRLYLVKPSPFAPGMTFDADTGQRLDPLNHDLLRQIADEKLLDTRSATIEPADDEFHRDYRVDPVPAAAVRMEGAQPSTLILSRHTGRTLRRIDSDAASFNWWYHQLHVFQWGPQMWLFTALLFAVALFALFQTASGGRLLWLRRHRRKGNTLRQRAFQTHRLFAYAVIVFLAAQMPIGAYMWLNLGPFQGGFRGKGTFNLAWDAGLPVNTPLETPAKVLAAVSPHLEGPAQWLEWRSRLGQPIVFASARKDHVGHAFTQTGLELKRLTPQEAGQIARQEVKGKPKFRFIEETEYYWNDLNRRIPAYKYRFYDQRSSDIFVSRMTGDIIARRTDFWRAFGPFLRLHAFAWTQDKVIDTVLLVIFQLALLGLIASGWRVHYATRRGKPSSRVEQS